MRKKHNILLVIPNSRWENKRPWLFIPHAVLLLTALLKEKYNFNIVDANGANLSEQECQNQIQANMPDIVLISAPSAEYHQQFHRVLALTKSTNSKIVTVLGGVYPTVLGEEAL